VSEPAQPPHARAGCWAAYALVLLLSLLLAVWASFLVPLRAGELVLPVAHVAVVAGNLCLGLAAGRLVGRAGAAGPGAVWLVVAMTLGSRRAEGDLVIPGTGAGVAYLALGALSAALAYGLSRGRPAQGLHPPG
jgi:hypothetical protein